MKGTKALEKQLVNGRVTVDREFVENCDKKFDEALSLAAHKVFSGEEKIIGLTGPTCSGKTTAAKKLKSIVEGMGKKMQVISLDDFFKDEFSNTKIDRNTSDADGLDFDSPDTMDMPLLSGFVHDLFSKGRAMKPTFDFKTGTRPEYNEIVRREDDVFVFEGIQVLYPEIVKLLGSEGSKTLFVCPQSSIQIGDKIFESNEIRLLRRIVRDKNFRDTNAGFTMALWDSVRRNEDNNILPNVDENCIMVDTTHAYEINILRPYLLEALEVITPDSKQYATRLEIEKKLEGIADADSAFVGKNSLYKEFV